MTTDPIVQFAQYHFGSNAGTPPASNARTPVPAWLRPGDENAVPADGEHTIRVEGDIGRPDPSNSLADSTSPDMLAYYLPFHFYPKHWGIYVRAVGVWGLAERLRPAHGSTDVTALDLSYRLLLEHERFHFFAEYAASRLEVVTRDSSYTEYFKDTEAAHHEEALANAHSIRVGRRRSAQHLADAAEAWMLTQPKGYRDFKQWLPPHFEGGQRHAAKLMSPAKVVPQLLAHVLANSPHPAEFHPAEFLFFRINARRTPVYIVLDASAPWLRVAKRFPKHFGLQVYVHANDHKPVHIHIDRPPGTPYTRYLWPALEPFPNDTRLRSSEEKALRRYVAAHGSAIARRIAAVPWQ